MARCNPAFPMRVKLQVPLKRQVTVRMARINGPGAFSPTEGSSSSLLILRHGCNSRYQGIHGRPSGARKRQASWWGHIRPYVAGLGWPIATNPGPRFEWQTQVPDSIHAAQMCRGHP